MKIKDFRKFHVLTVAVLVAVVACAPKDPRDQISAGTDYVLISSSVGHSVAEATAQVYAGDVAVFFSRTSEGRERARLVTLRAGAFERLRVAALEAVGRLRGASVFDPTCGEQLHRIEVSEGRGEPSRMQTQCLSDAFGSAQAELRRLLDAEIVE